MIYFYNDIGATNSIRISNSEIAELDLVAKIKESDLDKYLKKYLKKDTDVWFYYDLSDLAEDYDCQYVQNDEFGLWYTDENKKYNDIWKKSMKESKESVRKSIKESKTMTFEEFKKLCNDNFGYAIMDFNEYKGAYIVVVSADENATAKFAKILGKKGLEYTFYQLQNPHSEYYLCYEIMCV